MRSALTKSSAQPLRRRQPDLEHIVIGDAETLRQATAIFQRKIDVEEGLDATIRAALRRRLSKGAPHRAHRSSAAPPYWI